MLTLINRNSEGQNIYTRFFALRTFFFARLLLLGKTGPHYNRQQLFDRLSFQLVLSVVYYPELCCNANADLPEVTTTMFENLEAIHPSENILRTFSDRFSDRYSRSYILRVYAIEKEELFCVTFGRVGRNTWPPAIGSILWEQRSVFPRTLGQWSYS